MYLRIAKVIDVQKNKIFLEWLDGNGYAVANPTLAAGGPQWGIIAMPNIGDVAVCGYREGHVPVILGYVVDPSQLPSVEAGQVVILDKNGNALKLLGDNALRAVGVDIMVDASKKVDSIDVSAHSHTDSLGGATSGPAGGDGPAHGGVPAGAPVMVKLDEKIASVGGSVSFDFTNIPQTFRHLQVVYAVRGDAAGTLVSLGLRFNGDAGNNYDFEYLIAAAATTTPAEGLALSFINAGGVVAAGAPANLFGMGQILIPNYASTLMEKAADCSEIRKIGTASGNISWTGRGGYWRNIAAISQLTLFATAGSFAESSIATLYGLP
ncbi:MAG: hypothetical protein M1343_08500 [Chloroflexi bacterium]|nr:hypothetical protein [Chloroflexota bacterium]